MCAVSLIHSCAAGNWLTPSLQLFPASYTRPCQLSVVVVHVVEGIDMSVTLRWSLAEGGLICPCVVLQH
jgi:hypothetical protein